MRLEHLKNGWELSLAGRVLIRHSAVAPFLFIGRGEARMDMYRGNFDIEDYVIERVAMCDIQLVGTAAGYSLECRRERDSTLSLRLQLSGDANCLVLTFVAADPGINRVWVRLCAEPEERVWGCGEQMSYFDLRGRRFPLWTSEPGVGRDKSTAITFQADVAGKAGGDYYTTNYPQPTFVSSRRYFAHLETTAYADFDFRHAGFHELQAWAVPQRLEVCAAGTFLELIEAISARFGRQPPLPQWIYDGAIIGLKDGERSFERLERLIDAGVHVAALWCEDWAGVRETTFGTRLFWNWQWNPHRYPHLPARIAALARRGIRFFAYLNPYLCVDGELFGEADAAGYLARDADGNTYLVDFGEFDCGVVDFTNEAACRWFAERIIRRNVIDLGIAGWMADFGEYLPIDVRLADGRDARMMHNAWPTLWAKVNAEAVAAAGLTGERLFFMRAGFTGVQQYCPLLWAGDQCVDFSRHDGLGTVICGALSAGMMGNAFHHSDIGGYTSLFGNLRTAELMQRWAEMAAFTPVMRTHEGNRPRENLQIDTDKNVLAHFARMTRIYRSLAPYLRTLSLEAAERGIPVQRPLFLHFEADPQSYAVQDQYLYGPELLVAPVHAAGVEHWSVYLPAGATWIHWWTGISYPGGERVLVPAPLGSPPVFHRAGSPFTALFEATARL
jgi:sulfoquinovosidase